MVVVEQETESEGNERLGHNIITMEVTGHPGLVRIIQNKILWSYGRSCLVWYQYCMFDIIFQ